MIIRLHLLNRFLTQEHAKFILKVSYNIGADTSLMLLGLIKGKRTMADSLTMEKKLLKDKYDISSSKSHLLNGAAEVITTGYKYILLNGLGIMSKKPTFNVFFNALPILAVDGSLGFVRNFKTDATLAGAAGNIHAKPGSYANKR